MAELTNEQKIAAAVAAAITATQIDTNADEAPQVEQTSSEALSTSAKSGS